MLQAADADGDGLHQGFLPDAHGDCVDTQLQSKAQRPVEEEEDEDDVSEADRVDVLNLSHPRYQDEEDDDEVCTAT